MIFFEPGEHAAEGFAAVGDLGFRGHVEFGGGFVELGEEEEGVVAEAVGAARGAEHDAGDFIDHDGQIDASSTGRGQGQGAVELGLALVVGDGFEFGQDLGVVGGVDGVTVSPPTPAPSIGAGIACGEDAGAAGKGIDAETGIVGEGEGLCEVCEVAGFLGGVADEGGAVFDAVGEGREIFEREDAEGIVQAGEIEFMLDLEDFAGIGCGDEKIHGRSIRRSALMNTGVWLCGERPHSICMTILAQGTARRGERGRPCVSTQG